MSRWFRFYDDALNDPKVQALPPVLFKFWVNLLCVASRNEGLIPPLSSLKASLKARLDHVEAHLNELIKLGLIDLIGDRFEPHNWRKRQYKSDNSTPRVKRFRNVSSAVSETPPETDTETDTESKRESALRAPQAPSVSREAKKRQKARAPLPEPWSISEVERTYARSLGFADGQIASMASAFENHHRAKGSLMADWSAAWRTWCGNEIKFGRSAGNGFGGSRPLQDDSRSISRAAGRLAEAAERGEFSFGPRPSLLPAENTAVVQLLPKR